jgi:tyramine---L-glutamate ligase
MSDTLQADQVPIGLRSEGAAMLRTIVEGLARAGVALTVPLDMRLFQPAFIDWLAKRAEVIPLQAANAREVRSVWRAVSARSWWTWLVAPEIDGHLSELAAELRAVGGQLINANEEFLANASDKRLTARCLNEAGIAHPPTLRLLDLNAQWLQSARAESTKSPLHAQSGLDDERELWCVKPADGAGGEGLKIVTTEELRQLKRQCENRSDLSRESNFNEDKLEDKLIVQPWLTGIAASCSAFVDPGGHTTWLPLVSQDFALTTDDSQANSEGLGPHYVGSTYPVPGIASQVPVAVLEGTLKAMQGTPRGWIGIDLLFHAPTKQWCVIEVNPRCTTSMVGLAQAYQGNLVGDLCGWLTGRSSRTMADFRHSTFRVPREITQPD